MNATEFTTAVIRLAGSRPPHGWTGSGGRRDWYQSFTGLPQPGSGISIDYSLMDVRLAAAYLMVRNLGVEGTVARTAALLMTEHDDGWVTVSEGKVTWTPQPEIHKLNRGAAYLPVPVWPSSTSGANPAR